MQPSTRYRAWGTVALAVLAWSGYAWGVYLVDGARTLFIESEDRTTQATTNAALGSRTRSLLRDTRTEREIVDAVTKTDVVTAVSLIEAAGRSVGARVVIEGANASTVYSAGDDVVRAVTIIVSGEGSLASLVQFVSLLEVLPFASSIEGVDVRALEKGSEWRLNARIRMITTSNLGV